MMHEYLVVLVMLFAAQANAAESHLFILSGQSNMGPKQAASGFENAIQLRFPDDEITVVHGAKGGMPISTWGEGGFMWGPNTFRRALTNTFEENAGRNYDTVTFVWMQGEADTKTDEQTEAYEAKLVDLYDRVKKYAGVTEMYWVISRLNDANVPGGEADLKEVYQLDNWETIREIQVETANARDYAAWVDWDDLNGPLNTIHLAAADGSSTRQDSERYPELAERWAKAAADLIQGIRPDEEEDAPTVSNEQ
jgi:hypothetical protein